MIIAVRVFAAIFQIINDLYLTLFTYIMRNLLKTVIMAAIAMTMAASCDNGGSSSRNNRINLGDETIGIGSAYSFWWVSSDDNGRPWSNYEFLLLPCTSWDGYDDAEWDFYFDVYLDGAVFEIPTGRFELGNELDMAAFTLYTDDGYEDLIAASGVLEVNSLRNGYSITFNGTAEDGTPMSASWSGPVELMPM